jgi:hypothetical protein
MSIRTDFIASSLENVTQKIIIPLRGWPTFQGLGDSVVELLDWKQQVSF